ncbi:MAG: MFS transporter [Methanoregula sp.]|uniref:MFS transporter n=1 Tax=Methanoregula sp. TaxID=2052170 RepID=UPI00260081F1|nr:MFS transporter [Methanoregula sp.]MCK9632271.1 MFS transporter [Methanoregula sp.]
MSADPTVKGVQPGASRTLMYYLSLIGFFAIFSTTISKNPVLPLFVTAMGAGDSVLGLIAAVSPLAGILFSFPVGVLSDRIGRRRLLVASGCVFLLAPLLYLFIADPLWLVPVRFFHGTATAILGPVVSAIIAERFPDTKGEMLGTYSSATLIGRTIAPLAGGIIITAFAFTPGLFPYRMVYVAAALAAVPVFILILRYREESPGSLHLPGISVFKESLATFAGNRRLRATALADMATYFAFGAFETFLPVYLFALHFEAYQIGIIFAIQVLIIAVTKPFFGRIADRIDKRIQIIAGLLVTGGAIAAVPFAATWPGFLAASAVFGLGISLSTVATSAYVADVAKTEEIGASMGALSSIMDIGHAAGPLVTGIIITLAGYPSGFTAGLVLAVAVTAIFMLSVRNRDITR